MCLSARDRRALDSLEDQLAGSDPRLASLMATFTRLVSGEEGYRVQAPKTQRICGRGLPGSSRQARHRAGLAGLRWRVRYTVGRDTVNSSARSAME